jgi:dolichol-phosphate mannosyltransferase
MINAAAAFGTGEFDMLSWISPAGAWLALRRRGLRFCIVGASGVAINTGLLALLVGVLRLGHVPAAVVATEGSIVSNFVLHDRWTFASRSARHMLLVRFARYNLSSCGTLVLTVGILAALTSWFGVYYLLANLVAIAISTGANYMLSTRWAWRDTRAAPELQSIGGSP